MKRRSLSVLSLAAAVVLGAGCSSSDNPSGDGGGIGSGDGGPSADGPTPTGGALQLCQAAGGDAGPGFPQEIGESCAMGSNLALCASSTTSTQCNTGPCLWHRDHPGGERAYCTVACDPAEGAAACPDRFACQAQGCDDAPSHVCVEQSVSTGPARDCVEWESLLPGRGFEFAAGVQVGTGLYLAGMTSDPPACVVLLRGPGGASYDVVYDQPWEGRIDKDAFSDGDAAYFRLWKDGYAQKLLRVTSGGGALDKLPDCKGDPNECLKYIDLVFANPTGAPRGLGSNHDGDRFVVERDGQGTWTARGEQDLPFEGFLTWTPPAGGVIAIGREAGVAQGAIFQLAVSADGARWQVLALPASIKSLDLDQVELRANSIDDFFFAPGDEHRLLHRVGGEWVEEGPSSGWRNYLRWVDGTLYHLVPGAPNSKGVVTDWTVYRRDDRCWSTHHVGSMVAGRWSLEERNIGFVGTRGLCRTQLP